jgi:hypothetical protein
VNLIILQDQWMSLQTVEISRVVSSQRYLKQDLTTFEKYLSVLALADAAIKAVMAPGLVFVTLTAFRSFRCVSSIEFSDVIR